MTAGVEVSETLALACPESLLSDEVGSWTKIDGVESSMLWGSADMGCVLLREQRRLKGIGVERKVSYEVVSLKSRVNRCGSSLASFILQCMRIAFE